MARRLIVIALLAATAAALAPGCSDRDAETAVTARKLVTVTESDAIALPGQNVPARVDTVTLWIGPGLARRDVGSGSFLVDTHRDLLTYVDHESATWTRSTAGEVAGLLASIARDTVAAASQQMRMLRSVLEVSAQVTDTEETRRIDGYDCRRWMVLRTFGPQRTTTELWLTTDLDVDYSLLHRATQPSLAALPGGRQALSQLAELRGVPVRSSSTLEIMGGQTRSSSRLESATTERLPVSFFEPPDGYDRIDDQP